MARNRTADDFIQSNEEYTKLESQRPDGESFREQPKRQAPGRGGHDRQDFAEWTHEELCSYAERLGIADAPEMDRDALIAALVERDASHPRAR